MPKKFAKSKDVEQQRLRDAKRNWNLASRELIKRMIAFKQGINGRGNPNYSLPPSDIKEPIPSEVGSFASEIQANFAQLMAAADRIEADQAAYSARKQKQMQEREQRRNQPKTEQPPEIAKPASFTSKLVAIAQVLGLRTFYRVQPKGKGLAGHTSGLAYEKVPGIFAFESPEAVFDTYTWLHTKKDLSNYEMVAFRGRLLDSPPDSEGMVVLPEYIVQRIPLKDFAKSKGIEAALMQTIIKKASRNEMATGKLQIKEHEFDSLIARTAIEQEIGLMHRPPPTPVMTFVYARPQTNTFWMKSTPAPLDIVFALDGRVIGIHKGEPYSTATIGGHYSDLVIELPEGTCQKLGIREGDQVRLAT